MENYIRSQSLLNEVNVPTQLKKWRNKKINMSQSLLNEVNVPTISLVMMKSL